MRVGVPKWITVGPWGSLILAATEASTSGLVRSPESYQSGFVLSSLCRIQGLQTGTWWPWTAAVKAAIPAKISRKRMNQSLLRDAR